jgi:hypothetical protein
MNNGNGTKPTLANLLGTKNRDEQAQAVQILMQPTVALTILFDPRYGRTVVSVTGPRIADDLALHILDQARNTVIEKMTKGKGTNEGPVKPPEGEGRI